MGEPKSGDFSLRDFLLSEAGKAVSDVRAALIDEGWFGRSAPEPGEPSLSWEVDGPQLDGVMEDLMHSSSFAESWAQSGSGDPAPPDFPPPRTADERSALLSFQEAWAIREPSDKLDPGTDKNLGVDR